MKNLLLVFAFMLLTPFALASDPNDLTSPEFEHAAVRVTEKVNHVSQNKARPGVWYLDHVGNVFIARAVVGKFPSRHFYVASGSNRLEAMQKLAEIIK